MHLTYATPTKGTVMRTSETLMAAARAIEERGWAQGVTDENPDPWGINGGPVCIEGAIMAATGERWHARVNECPAYDAVAQFLGEPRSYYSNGVDPFFARLYAWNDTPGRTKAEVIEVLKAAAIAELCKEKAAELDLRDAVNEAMAPALREPVLA